MLEIKHLTYGYDKDTLLFENFSLDLGEKELIQVVGKNGSGKTTFFNLLTGITELKKSEYELFYQQQPITVEDLAGSIGYCSVKEQLFEHLSIQENIQIFAKIFDEDDVYKANVVEFCEFLELNPQDNKPISEFSSGMKQKLWIALNIKRNVPILLFDEPFRTLDTESVEKVAQALKELDKCTLVVAHDSSEFSQVADRKIYFGE